MKVNVDFAQTVSLKHHYFDTVIDAIITDENDVALLKRILNGRAYKESPSCGFGLSTSIAFSDEARNVFLCPARDGCPLVEVSTTKLYLRLTTEERELLDQILAKYGIFFPCI